MIIKVKHWSFVKTLFVRRRSRNALEHSLSVWKTDIHEKEQLFLRMRSILCES